MDRNAFADMLTREGFPEPAAKTTPPGTFNDTHSHPFEVCALVLDGELTLSWDDQQHTYRAGDVFRMAAGCPHVESYGAAGATTLVSRRGG